jgi:hypothetical protein
MLHKHLCKFLILKKQIDEVGEEEAHKLWQVKEPEGWADCTINEDLLFNVCYDYRLKPKTRTLKWSKATNWL